jgi:transposase
MARQDVKDEVIHLRSAGVDLGKRFLLACTRTPSPKRPGSWSLETERFGTTQAEVRRLLAWLVEARVEVVVMEATSDYWRSVYYMLQPHLNLMLVNPAHLKGIRGRKTDPSDAAFLARAGASGMAMEVVNSFVYVEVCGLTGRALGGVTFGDLAGVRGGGGRGRRA